jgi:hypothetical protein
MHHVTKISHRIQKRKFDVTCPDTLFMETAPIPPEHEKYCVNVLRPGGTRMYYVTRRYHRMETHMFGVRCPDAFAMESLSVPPEQEK